MTTPLIAGWDRNGTKLNFGDLVRVYKTWGLDQLEDWEIVSGQKTTINLVSNATGLGKQISASLVVLWKAKNPDLVPEIPTELT